MANTANPETSDDSIMMIPALWQILLTSQTRYYVSENTYFASK